MIGPEGESGRSINKPQAMFEFSGKNGLGVDAHRGDPPLLRQRGSLTYQRGSSPESPTLGLSDGQRPLYQSSKDWKTGVDDGRRMQ